MALRDKERNRKRRKYGQAQLKHSKRGVISCILSGIVLVILVTLLATAYRSGGKAAPVIGGFGLIAVVLACWGLYTGIRGFKEREKNYLTCKIGVGCSAFFIFGFVLIFCRGLF